MTEVIIHEHKAEGAGEISRPQRVDMALTEAQVAFERGDLQLTRSTLADISEVQTLTPLQVATWQLLEGKVRREQGEFGDAKVCFETARTAAAEAGLSKLEATTINQLASIYSFQGDPAMAITYLEQAADLFRQLDSKRELADVLTNAGYIHRELTNYQTSLEVLKEAFDLIQDCAPESRSAAINLQNLGLTYVSLGRFNRAVNFYKDALTMAGQLGDQDLEIVSIINLGEAYLGMDRLSEAEAAYEDAIQLSKRCQLPIYQVNAIEGLGNVFYKKALYTRAHATHQKALELATSISDIPNMLMGQLNLARDEFAIHAFGSAITHAESALLMAEQTESLRPLYQAHELLAQVHKRQGNLEKAIYHLEAFQSVKERVLNEQNAETTRRLALKFELEKAQHETEMYRLRSEMSQQAHQEAELLVQARTRELEEAQTEIVTRLAVAAEYRDDDTGEHTRRVGRNAALIAYVLGWSLEETRLIFTAARLHDVGKIGIADSTLLKPGKLTQEEFSVMRSHTRIGASILANGRSPLLQLAEAIAQSHHEQFDGRGYPQGLAGEAIPLSARIVAVADVLDALTHERPYKAAWPLEAALAEIERGSGTHFDPTIVAVSLALFAPHGHVSPLDSSEDWQDLLRDLEKIAAVREAFVP